MELNMDDEPLDFELEDDFAPPKATTNKRKKMIDLDDLLLDCQRDEERLKKIKTSKGVKANKRSAVDEDEERLSKAVDDVHRLIKEIDGQDNTSSNGLEVKDEIPFWGMQVLGTQKALSPVHCPAIEKSALFQTFISADLNSLIELSPAKGEVFLEGFLLNGWLLKYALYCGHVEVTIARWSLNLLLFSPEESLSSAACDFWCSIMLKNKADSSIKIEWLPSYSLLKGVLESYGFLLHSQANMQPDTEINSDGLNAKTLLNLRAWIKLVDACCQARRCPMFSTNEVEELAGYVICLLLDRRLQGLSVCLNQCICSCIGFFEEEEWNTSCEAVAKFLACRVPRNMNCLRIVECISGINSRTMMLRSRIAFEVLKLCFQEAVDVHDILRALISINVKCTSCNLFDIYIYIVLTENLLIFNDLRDEEVVDMWGIFLRKCSTHITNTNFRPYAQEVRNRASYILQSSTH